MTRTMTTPGKNTLTQIKNMMADFHRRTIAEIREQGMQNMTETQAGSIQILAAMASLQANLQK